MCTHAAVPAARPLRCGCIRSAKTSPPIGSCTRRCAESRLHSPACGCIFSSAFGSTSCQCRGECFARCVRLQRVTWVVLLLHLYASCIKHAFGDTQGPVVVGWQCQVCGSLQAAVAVVALPQWQSTNMQPCAWVLTHSQTTKVAYIRNDCRNMRASTCKWDSPATPSLSPSPH